MSLAIAFAIAIAIVHCEMKEIAYLVLHERKNRLWPAMLVTKASAQDNGNYRRKVSYLRAKLSNLRATRIYAHFPSLSRLSCRRPPGFSLRHLRHARNHRLTKIRRPAVVPRLCTHLQNKNTHSELITFCPRILVRITSLRVLLWPHGAFQRHRGFRRFNEETKLFDIKSQE